MLTKPLAIVALAVLCGFLPAYAQTPHQAAQPQNAAPAPSVAMPSEDEIRELVNKASEYVATYKRTFTNAKPSLAKASNPGFYEKAVTLTGQADDIIAAIKKNGSTGVSLVSLIVVLDDMSLNATRASAETMLVAAGEDRANPKNHAMQDFQDLAQAGTNCYDISELLFHATIRYISGEETALRVLLDERKK